MSRKVRKQKRQRRRKERMTRENNGVTSVDVPLRSASVVGATGITDVENLLASATAPVQSVQQEESVVPVATALRASIPHSIANASVVNAEKTGGTVDVFAPFAKPNTSTKTQRATAVVPHATSVASTPSIVHATVSCAKDPQTSVAQTRTSETIAPLVKGTRVGITPLAHLKLLRMLTLCGQTEFSVFGFMPDAAARRITDLIVPKQLNSVGSTRMDDEHLAMLFSRLSEQGLEYEQYGCVWIHSHPSFAVMPSDTDWATLDRTFARHPWVLMIIVSLANGEFKSSVHLKMRTSLGTVTRQLGDLAVDYANGAWPREVEDWVEGCKAKLQVVSCHNKHASGESRQAAGRDYSRWDFKRWSLKALLRLAHWIEQDDNLDKWLELEEELQEQVGLKLEMLVDDTLDWYKYNGMHYVWDGEHMCEAVTGIEIESNSVDWIMARASEVEASWDEPQTTGDDDDQIAEQDSEEAQVEAINHDDGARVATKSYESVRGDCGFGEGVGCGGGCSGGRGCWCRAVSDVGEDDPAAQGCPV